MGGTKESVRSTALQGSDGEFLGRQYTNLVDDLEKARLALDLLLSDGVVFAATGPGLSVDANAADVETDNAVIIRHKGLQYALAAIAAIDISALIGQASTIATSKFGALWVFGDIDGSTADVEPDKAAAAYDSEIIALAQYAIATLTLPPTATLVPIGVVTVGEGGSGTFTWGTDSITDETELYYSFNGQPGIITAAASFAATAGGATYAYGAGKLRLGSGTIVTYTGKTGVTIAGSVIKPGFTGAWLFYVKADDVEYAAQVAVTYASLDAARSAVKSLKKNPLMPLVGAIYVTNRSEADFTPGTTLFSAAGISAVFDINPNLQGQVDQYTDFAAAPVELVT